MTLTVTFLVVIWGYASIHEGPGDLRASYIIIGAHEEHDRFGSSNPRIASYIDTEPSLARREALAYLDRFSKVKHPFAMANMDGKNKCASLIAYTAFLVRFSGRGILDEGKNVLEGLLSAYTFRSLWA